MYCPKCGAQNPDNATFCEKCGNPLTTTAASPPSTGPASSPMAMNQGKNPIVAAVLNLFWGLGYWYLGYKKVLGIQTMLFVVIMLIVYILLGFFLTGIIPLIIAIVLAVDGYQKGQGQKGFIGAER